MSRRSFSTYINSRQLSREVCPTCSGTREVCHVCNGTKDTCTCTRLEDGLQMANYDPVQCPECRGIGTILSKVDQ